MKLQLSSFPDGTLSCAKNGSHYKWYQQFDNKRIYIPKKNRPLAEALAQKKYLSLLLKDLSREKRAVQFYLEHHPNTLHSDSLLLHPEFGSLLAPHFIPINRELSDWINAPYEHNSKHPEHLLHKSTSGNLLRSKSELIIDTLLYKNQIPFRYECALTLGKTTFFPDFTIRHPKTGDTFYWEHFGLMDDAEYAKNACSKLQLYTSHGIVPSIHLITTYETKVNPLGFDMVEKIIEHYFL